MVAMQVRDEYMIQSGEMLVRFSYLQLGAFAAIYHQQFVAYPDYL